jgi:hypothetical protein
MRPNAVEDIARIVKASLVNGACSRQTVAVLGPEELTLRDTVLRVANVVGRVPLIFRMPVWFHHLLGWCVEGIMTVPLVSRAQVRMLAEGMTEPWPPCEILSAELAPRIPFTESQIRQGLPRAGSFEFRDLRCCVRRKSRGGLRHGVFFELP